MICKICHLSIISNQNHQAIQLQYIKLFRKMCPRRPIQLMYCTDCYCSLINELENEIHSQTEYLNAYNKELELLKNTGKQTYSITDTKDNTMKRYTVLDEHSDEYKHIKKKFEKTLSYKILRIEKSNNPILEKKFMERSSHLTCENIKYLFHGSNDKAYDNILETGFDLEYASPHGLIGAGIYFAKDASYSHGYGRITSTNLGKINHILYCKVNVGKTCLGHTGLMQTPAGFDGVHSDYRTYAFFDNYQGIPEYIIYYLVEDHI